MSKALASSFLVHDITKFVAGATSFQKKNYLNEIIIPPKKIEKILLPVLCFDQLKGFPEK
jgi:hypothetical protein